VAWLFGIATNLVAQHHPTASIDLAEELAMPTTDDLTAIRQLLDVPHPGDAVTAAGRAPAGRTRSPGG
jgi:hypothetical protein